MSTPIHLLFNEEVEVGKTVLFPGRYEAILVQRANNSGVLYFRMGEDLDMENTIARVAVKISPLAADEPRTPVVERGADGILRLVELRFRAQPLRLILYRLN